MASVLAFEPRATAPAPIGAPLLTERFLTAARIAELELPGLPRSKRGVQERAHDECWALKHDPAGQPLTRIRRGRGGQIIEYSAALLPAAARLALAKSNSVPVAPPVLAGASWAWFDAQPEPVKREAKRRAAAIDAVERATRAGATRSLAVSTAAGDARVSSATVWNWLGLVDGVAAVDWLPALAPRRKGGGAEADVDADAWLMLKSDYLRPEKPSWTSCCERAASAAAGRGVELPHWRTLWRKFKREVDPRLIVERRSGTDALRNTLPPQQRTVAGLHALQLVNIDGHQADVFVRWPSGRIGRPVIVAIQDVYSRKMLAWRIGESEDAVLTRLAFFDLFRDYGIPRACLLDNGRAFASKWITGGAKTRFRFKIRDEEPTGILTALGIDTHWARPYRGQSKPIERGFRDFCDTIAKHPAFAGAYTGNRPDAKPDNYGETAIALDVFAAVFAKGVVAHNAKAGRRTEMARGRSFDVAFAESYAVAPIGRASPEQLRMALLTAEDVRTDAKSGAITQFGNRFWAPELAQLAGKRVVVRFDPDDLQTEVHVYARDGRFLVTAPVIEATGFLDAGAAKARAKLERDWKKQVRALRDAEDLLSADAIAAMLPDVPDAMLPEPAVLRPVRHRGQSAAARALAAAPDAPLNAPATPSVIDRLSRLRLVE